MKKMIYLGLILFTICIVYYFRPVHISGDSMSPTLVNSETVLMRKKLFFNKIGRNDIIFFQDPYGSGNLVVKRVVGMPNETIYCENGKLFVNGVICEDKYQLDKNTKNFGPITLSEDEYFVLGDHRDASTDSRVFGGVKNSNIKGFYIEF